MNKVFATWDEAELFARSVSENAEGVSGVYGVPRGGLCLAVMVSHALGVPILAAPDDHALIIDDVIDTGAALLKEHNRGRKIAALYRKEGAAFSPDYYLKTVASDCWVVFPWEVENESRGIMRECS